MQVVEVWRAQGTSGGLTALHPIPCKSTYPDYDTSTLPSICHGGSLAHIRPARQSLWFVFKCNCQILTREKEKENKLIDGRSYNRQDEEARMSVVGGRMRNMSSASSRAACLGVDARAKAYIGRFSVPRSIFQAVPQVPSRELASEAPPSAGTSREPSLPSPCSPAALSADPLRKQAASVPSKSGNPSLRCSTAGIKPGEAAGPPMERADHTSLKHSRASPPLPQLIS
jgi:hypothetical protein